MITYGANGMATSISCDKCGSELINTHYLGYVEQRDGPISVIKDEYFCGPCWEVVGPTKFPDRVASRQAAIDLMARKRQEEAA